MIQPTLDAGIEFGEGDAAGLPGLETIGQAAGGLDDLAGFDAAVAGPDEEAEPGDAGVDGLDLCGGLMDGEAQGSQALHHGLLPIP
jgi:hypothetical protein